MSLKRAFYQSMTLMGRVAEVSADRPEFRLTLRSGDDVTVHLMATTWIEHLKNLDLLDRDRFPADEEDSGAGVIGKMRRYFGVGPVDPNRAADPLVAVQGTYYVDGEKDHFDGLVIHILHSSRDHWSDPAAGRLLFEHTAWWGVQMQAMADQWLDSLFGEKRTYLRDDFAALYRTNLNILGLPTDDNVQEVATLSRLIYGLSSAFLLTGQERYYLAAKAGVEYQREAFRLTSTDGRFCFWAHAKKKLRYGSRKIMPSEAKDDRGSIPLYEQIYALAGLSHYYRITQDPEVLYDIRRTVAAFRFKWFYHHDEAKGFYSHIDYASFSPHDPKLDKNRSRKNWNSIGDHIPAYLIDLILAFDPLPKGAPAEIGEFSRDLIALLDEVSDLIAEKFPEPNAPYVIERFKRTPDASQAGTYTEWVPDKEWDWQQDRAVVGHNLKIAWNLTRVANFNLSRARKLVAENLLEEAASRSGRARTLLGVATRLADDMAKLGIDQIRGGCFDSVERAPKNGMPVQFPWRTTKDFWQQEQGILAYLILYGHLLDAPEQADRRRKYLKLARETSAFWNLFFLDRERSGIFFRVTADGIPVIEGDYGNKGGHSISGYHAFELNYLAQIYQRSYLQHQERDFTTFAMSFLPGRRSGFTSINVLPDFVKPGDLEIAEVLVDGIRKDTTTMTDLASFQVPLTEADLDRIVTVKFRQSEGCFKQSSSPAAPSS